jgi:signal transduction histidine kinase
MQHRADLRGGRFKILTRPQGGTGLAWSAPVIARTTEPTP